MTGAAPDHSGNGAASGYAADNPHRHSPKTGNPPTANANPTRILLVSALPPPPGGIATWTQTILDRGLPPTFELEVIDTRVYRQSQFTPSRPTPPEIWRNLRILWRIRRALASGRFSLMHLNCGLTLSGVPRNLASALAAQRAGVPYVAHLHGTFHVPTGNTPTAQFYRRAWRRILSGAAQILALGQPSYRAILELGDFAPKTTPLLPNFVNAQSIPSHISETAPDARPPDSLKIVYTAALIADKGVYTILELAQQIPNAQFQLIGGSSDPASHARLLRRIAELDLTQRVQILGPIPNREVIQRLAENDLFLFPSQLRFEGFPISVAEAMAAGLPIVASPVGALPEMVDVPQGGALIAPNNLPGYVKILECLRQNPALRATMGRHNRRKARQQYDYDVVIRRLCGIWAAAAGHAPPPDRPAGSPGG